MPKRKEPPSTPEEQSKRFQSEVERLIEAGELNPIEAEEKLEGLLGNAVRTGVIPAKSYDSAEDP